jgi:hypothetical protein
MIRSQAAAAVASYLQRTVPESEFIRDRNIFVVLGADRPLCLVACATGRRPSAEERVEHARLRACGYRVVVVHGAAEAELALDMHGVLAAIRQRKANRMAAVFSALFMPVRLPASRSHERLAA